MIKNYVFILMLVFITSNTAESNLVSLAYDDGSAEDGVWIDDLRGHAVVFEAPCDNWVLSEIAIFGRLAPQPKSDNFVVEVWDSNLSQLSKSMERSKSFFGENFTWSVIDIPDVKVSGSVIVSFYEFAGIYLGTDVSQASGRSILAARNPNRILNWDVQNHTRNETNWMIRLMGFSPAPAINLKVLSDKASQNSPAKIEVEAWDADDNIESATLYIVDNKTSEIVWSEVKELEGGAARVQFFWPGTMFQVSVNSLNDGPVLAVNNIGIRENLSALLAYFAPCVLEIEENSTVSTVAYFGKDGKFNALIDTYGFTHFLSQDMFNKTSPDQEYMEYIKNNITLEGGKSRIDFFKIRAPFGSQEQTTAIVGPIAFSGSPLFNYGLNLKRASAGTGDYVVAVQVEDSALNAIREVSDKVIKII